MLKVENNLGDLASPSLSLPLSFLSSPAPFSPSPFIPLYFILHLLPSPFTRLSALLRFSLLLSPPEWPDAGNFTTVDLFTFLQSWECMNIYDAGLSLWGICLYSLLICACVCVPVCIISMIFHWMVHLSAVGFCVFTSYRFYVCIFIKKENVPAGQNVCVCVCVRFVVLSREWSLGLWTEVSSLLSVRTCGLYERQGKTRWKKSINILWELKPQGSHILSFLSLNTVINGLVLVSWRMFKEWNRVCLSQSVCLVDRWGCV